MSISKKEFMKRMILKMKKKMKMIQIKTPLFIAIKKQNIEIIKLLLNHKGININAKVEIELINCYGRDSDYDYDYYPRRRRYRIPTNDCYDEIQMKNKFEAFDHNQFYENYEKMKTALHLEKFELKYNQKILLFLRYLKQIFQNKCSDSFSVSSLSRSQLLHIKIMLLCVDV